MGATEEVGLAKKKSSLAALSCKSERPPECPSSRRTPNAYGLLAPRMPKKQRDISPQNGADNWGQC
jgi:hypothetical protein